MHLPQLVGLCHSKEGQWINWVGYHKTKAYFWGCLTELYPESLLEQAKQLKAEASNCQEPEEIKQKIEQAKEYEEKAEIKSALNIVIEPIHT